MEKEMYKGIEITYKTSKQDSLNCMGFFFYELLEKKIKEGLIEVKKGKIIKLKEEKKDGIQN